MMFSDSTIILILLFTAIFSFVLFALQSWQGNQQKKRLSQLAGVSKDTNRDGQEQKIIHAVSQVVDPFSKLSMPAEGWQNSTLQSKFVHAGWRNPNIVSIFFGTKTILTFGLPLTIYLVLGNALSQNNLLLLLLLSATIGIYLPNLILINAINKRQKNISDNFPDALDLLVITMEAGLSFDLALAKVANEIKINCQILSDELNMVLLEMRTGFSRERALRNLAMRTGVDNIDALATLVIQSERYGTSVGESLRIQSEHFRLQRKLKAEERAAKIGVKLLFPLILFIMPSLFIVLLGPAVLQVMQTFAN